ncbi:hypothetical protein [Mesorhizobium sp. M00.F.Ca.ET.216.01.1.1]|uniref:hypothetical protein n=1 Tax=Mesorhizobium sp. M00.F.Ca.ET.216.01.1.1 TaxID=2500528 RepID=UPI0016759839|nr:hypothetical protein [Mesorhizobium sp. M00.F.Ca.ET.216.01.1.1]
MLTFDAQVRVAWRSRASTLPAAGAHRRQAAIDQVHVLQLHPAHALEGDVERAG